MTWSASRGSIEANGRFTAPGLGGVSRITATSVADPNVTLTVAVIEECTFAEVVANQIPFTGDVVATSTWDAQYDSSCLKVKLSMQAISQDDAAVFDHQQNCGGSQGINGGFGGVSVEACQISFSEVAPCGQLSRISWSPDLDSDGLDKRRYASFLAAPDCSSVLYSATGVLSR